MHDCGKVVENVFYGFVTWDDCNWAKYVSHAPTGGVSRGVIWPRHQPIRNNGDLVGAQGQSAFPRQVDARGVAILVS